MRYADITNLSDWQKCREQSVFCECCYHTNDIDLPKTFAMWRFPCPECGEKGMLRKVHDRMEYL